MDTRHLLSFLKIAETGSISRAAESLRLSQPSLSQQLLRLEDEIGVALFRRMARGVALTEAGRVFLEHARQILRSTSQAVEDLRDLTTEVSGDVVVALPYSVIRHAGILLVEAFAKHAPNIGLRLTEAGTGQIRGWLDQGKIDLGILYDLGPLRHLSALPIATDELYLVGPRGRFGTVAEPGRVSCLELAQLPMIIPGPEHGLRQLIDQTTNRMQINLHIRQELDATVLVCPLIARGHGYSILPLPALGEDLAEGHVSIARVGDDAILRTLSLVRNTKQVVTQASVRAEDLIIKVLVRLIAKGSWIAQPLVPMR